VSCVKSLIHPTKPRNKKTKNIPKTLRKSEPDSEVVFINTNYGEKRTGQKTMRHRMRVLISGEENLAELAAESATAGRFRRQSKKEDIKRIGDSAGEPGGAPPTGRGKRENRNRSKNTLHTKRSSRDQKKTLPPRIILRSVSRIRPSCSKRGHLGPLTLVRDRSLSYLFVL